MKWIKDRQKFLNEAKLRDVIFSRQAKEVSRIWGEKFLDYEEVTPTDKIKQGKWKLSDEDKNKVLGKFFDCDMTDVNNVFNSLSDKFAEVLAQSIDLDLIGRSRNEKFKIIATDLNIKNPSIDQIAIIFDSVFRKIAVSETMATEIIQKGEDGRPLKDEAGNMIKVAKAKGELVFSNNLVNINTFVDDFNRCFPEEKVNADFNNRNIGNLRNMASIDENRDFEVDFKIFDKDMYLAINHNPKDILNMSISKFYASCQHLYSGGYREQVLGNVFDPNSIPAFLTFETPIYWNKEKISEQLPLSRMMIRNIETFDAQGESKIFFDRAYPDRMKEVFGEMVEKYTEMKQTADERSRITYIFTPDIDAEDRVRDPYMDRLGLQRKPYIGKNTKTLYLNRMHDWSNVKIAPDAKIKELIIETTDIPEDLTKVPLNPDWVKFKYLSINTLSNFDKIKTDSIAFDKCKLDTSVLEEMNKTNPNIKKLQIVSCDLTGELGFSQFKNLEELHIVYTLDTIEEIKDLTENLGIKKLVLSGDLLRDKEAKAQINQVRSRGIKVEVVGPVI
jgi:hypothetical protein